MPKSRAAFSNSMTNRRASWWTLLKCTYASTPRSPMRSASSSYSCSRATSRSNMQPGVLVLSMKMQKSSIAFIRGRVAPLRRSSVRGNRRWPTLARPWRGRPKRSLAANQTSRLPWAVLVAWLMAGKRWKRSRQNHYPRLKQRHKNQFCSEGNTHSGLSKKWRQLRTSSISGPFVLKKSP